ncbi:MAG: PaaI family thioesterase [Pseudomonadota bacterium]
MMIDVPETLEDWNARGSAYLPGHMALKFTEVGPMQVRAEVEIKKSHLSWNGFLHAGTVVTLADTCCGYGTVAALPEGSNGFTTVDLTSNFLGSVQDGKVVCTAKPLHTGRSTQVWDATVSSAAGKKMANFRCTQLILWPR